MIDDSQRPDSAEAANQPAEWTTPEVVRIGAGSAELDFSGQDDGLGLTS